jgi:hypothetical protein
MIAGIFHQGSGLGDQLMRYITVRTLAEEKGFKWGMCNQQNFKGDFFIDFNRGGDLIDPEYQINTKSFNEKEVRKEGGLDIRSYDPEINFVEDNTIIDGAFEDFKYWGHNLDNIRKWLVVEPLKFWDNECIIGFRGGEYTSDPDLFLTKDYWEEAIFHMRNKGVTKFEVHTDDPTLAKAFFSEILPWPDFKVIENEAISHSKHSNMGLNWRAIRYAKNLIIANSSFYILPSLLGEAKEIIAPRYWARRNTKVWARPACYYKRFTYV